MNKAKKTVQYEPPGNLVTFYSGRSNGGGGGHRNQQGLTAKEKAFAR